MEAFHRCKKMKTFIKKYCLTCKFRMENIIGNCSMKPAFYGYYCEKYIIREENG